MRQHNQDIAWLERYNSLIFAQSKGPQRVTEGKTDQYCSKTMEDQSGKRVAKKSYLILSLGVDGSVRHNRILFVDGSLRPLIAPAFSGNDL